jgi:hypothetical protein
MAPCSTKRIGPLIALALLAGCGDRKRLTLQCSTGWYAEQRWYTLVIDQPRLPFLGAKARLVTSGAYWVDLRVVRIDDVGIVLEQTARTADWPDGVDLVYLSVNRTNAVFEVSHLQRRKPADQYPGHPAVQSFSGRCPGLGKP